MVILIYFLVIIAIAIIGVPTIKGFLGEASIKLFLRKLDAENYMAVHNVLLPNNGGTAQIDHVVVSRYGIFVIETKNYQGWIFGKEHSKYWTQVIYKRKEKFFNPIHQNYGHIKALETLLGNHYTGPFYSIVAFNMRATLKDIEVKSTDVDVVYSRNVVKTIKSRDESVLPQNEMKNIVETITNASISGDRKARKTHVKAIKTNLKEHRKKVEANQCPKCGGQLVQRKGKYGFFTGCNNYPKCRYIVKKAR